MSASAVGSIVVSLGLVLGLLGLATRLLRRFAGRLSVSRGQIPLAVVQRIAVGPKQGIAIVKIGSRALAVSIGEGGMRPLMELDEADSRELELPVPVAPPALPPRVRELRAVLRSAVRSAALVLALFLAIPPAPAAAQAAVARTSVATPTPAAPAVARVDTAITRLAPQIDLRVGEQGGGGLRLSGTVGVVVMMGLLTLLPTLLLMMTGFTRILVVLHFLRQAMGTQSAPPAHLVAALAMLLTGFVMAPTLSEVNRTALQPWMDGQMEQAEMLQTGVKPFRAFMTRQVRERDVANFLELSSTPRVGSIDEVPLVVLISAFVTSELRAAFQIGFALFLPFIIIDLVVASVLMSMGMMMLPPGMIALPFKLLLFVLVDGWSLIVQGLITSFH